jgi:hypothetical protein
MIGWLSVAQSKYVCTPMGLPIGTINVDTLGNDFAMLTGNVLALFTSPIICAIITYIRPQNYDWEDLKRVTDTYLVGEDRHASKEQVLTCLPSRANVHVFDHFTWCIFAESHDPRKSRCLPRFFHSFVHDFNRFP